MDVPHPMHFGSPICMESTQYWHNSTIWSFFNFGSSMNSRVIISKACFACTSTVFSWFNTAMMTCNARHNNLMSYLYYSHFQLTRTANLLLQSLSLLSNPASIKFQNTGPSARPTLRTAISIS